MPNNSVTHLWDPSLDHHHLTSGKYVALEVLKGDIFFPCALNLLVFSTKDNYETWDLFKRRYMRSNRFIPRWMYGMVRERLMQDYLLRRYLSCKHKMITWSHQIPFLCTHKEKYDIEDFRGSVGKSKLETSELLRAYEVILLFLSIKS